MSVSVQSLPRAFRYNGMMLPDVSPSMSPEQVRDVYSATYPEIHSATCEGPVEENGQLIYEFKRAVGTKG